MMEAGQRVTEWGSLKVGTIEKAWDTACLVRWDYPRLRNSWGSVEWTTYAFYDRLSIASEYAERHNKYQLARRAKAPRPDYCEHCGGERLVFIERQHISHNGTPYIYAWQCEGCKRLTWVDEKESETMG